jgi:YidC/Oxa1 family membrane protein insertase
MEKRTIFAFVLSFAILLAWSFFFSPKEEQQPPKQQPAVTLPEETKPAQKGPDVIAPRPVQPPLGETAPSASAQKDVAVETPLYIAVLSNEGGRITSFRLKNYRMNPEAGSPPVELMHGVGNEQGYFAASFEPAAAKDRKENLFQVAEDRIKLEAGGAPKEVTFRGKTPEGINIEKTYRFHPDRYPIDLTVAARNESTNSLDGNFRASLRNTPPADKQSYYSFTGIAVFRNRDLQEFGDDDLKKEEKSVSGKIQWMAYETDYFMAAFVPMNTPEATFIGRKQGAAALSGILSNPSISLAPGDLASAAYTLYLGPRELTILKEMNVDLEAAIDFGWTDIIAKPLLYALRFFERYVGNYGIAIILLTVLIKILFWPLTHKSYKSMKEMQKLQPLMAKMREKYKGNREQMNKEMMALYRTYKVNPMGGCLPMVIQIPVFFALFRILGSAIELRHAPFMWWINDLSAPDRLFHFPFSIPFMTPPYGIPVLTLFMGASMFIQQKMTPTPGDQTQAKIMMLMPIVFTVMFINFPSGLVLYWLINNILSIGQQYRILKKPA